MSVNALNKIAMSLMLWSAALSPLAASEVEALSPELRLLLQKEMVALERGMQQLIPAYIAGDMGAVATLAGQMKSGYILRQSLTPAQQRELKEKLPSAFLQRDGQFHRYAGMLSHVAEEKHTELVSFYMAKMLDGCLGCHSDYAKHRFPALSKPAHDAHHH
jgi:hypothetical protein